MADLREYLRTAEAYHGHICSRQTMGIRVAFPGLRLLGLSAEDELRDPVVFPETDRCVADAACVVTGVTGGRRRVKVFGYGKTAMSFLDLKSGGAFRVSVKTSDRPPHSSPEETQVAFWEGYADEDIFSCREVSITLPGSELPGPPASVFACAGCGEDVLDRKEVDKDGPVYCRACAKGAYYRPLVGESA